MIKNHRWQDWERDIIRREYKHNAESRRRIAEKLTLLTGENINECMVSGQISIMGIARKDLRKPWTEEEKERLRELIPTYSPRRVAKMMHRGLNSVVVMSKRLGLSRRARNGWYCKREVTEIFGVDHKTVQSWIDSGALKAKSHYEDSKPQKLGGSSWHIDEKDLKDFIMHYPEMLHGRNVDIIQIVQILVGIKN